MNLLTGTVFIAELPIFYGCFKKPKFSHKVKVNAEIIKESYGEKTGQHTFTFLVKESSDITKFEVGKKYKKKGRNLYPNLIEIISQPENEAFLSEEKKIRKAKAKAKAKANKI